jgi:hypothetical protein
MARPTLQSVNANWDYNVSTQPLFTKDGRTTGWFGNFREGVDAPLGVCTEYYGLIQNKDLMDKANEAMTSRGLTPSSQKLVVAGNGERFYATFDFKDKTIPVPKVGDELGFRLTLQNSFDRSLRASWALGFLRLVCSNGMVTMEKEFSLTKKHSTKMSLDFIGDALDRAVNGFEKSAEIFSLLAEKSLSDEQGKTVLRNLTEKDILSDSVREGVEGLWLAPKRDEDKARNLFNLYNAATDYLTHQVESERFEYAQRTNGRVLFELNRAARSQNVMDALLKPVIVQPAKAVVLANN